MTSASDVRTKAQERLGRLAERAQDPTLAADPADNDQLDAYLEEALIDVAKQTGRLETTTTPTTTAGQGWVDLPPHVDVIEEAEVWDGSAAYDLGVQDGSEVARLAQSADAKEGRPKFIGSHAGKLWLYKVPDATYELALVCKMNGHVTASPAPGDDTVPPGLDALVGQVPNEMRRALVAYVVAEWLADSGKLQLEQRERRRYERDIQKFDTDPQRKTTHARPYNPLGI